MNEWEWQLLEDKTPVESVLVAGEPVKKGTLVRLRPKRGGDIFDLALAEQLAIVESIEQDYEGKLQLAVVLENDPGKEFGMLRQPGHRFFFAPEEVEPVTRILIAGIGNIFLGDDGFGVEAARRLAERGLPPGVRVQDFGIRGYDLAYALLGHQELTILMDAAPCGDEPGAVYLIEPDLKDDDEAGPMDAHAMNPARMLRLARSMGSVTSRVLVVGCEPLTLGGEEGHMGLSEVVSCAVEEALKLIGNLIEQTPGAEATDTTRS